MTTPVASYEFYNKSNALSSNSVNNVKSNKWNVLLLIAAIVKIIVWIVLISCLANSFKQLCIPFFIASSIGLVLYI